MTINKALLKYLPSKRCFQCLCNVSPYTFFHKVGHNRGKCALHVVVVEEVEEEEDEEA